MKSLKNLQLIGRCVLQLITLIFTGVILFLIYAMLGTLIPYQSKVEGGPLEKIYVRSNGLHTDICMPVKNNLYDWSTFINTKDYPTRKYNYIAIGWGDRAFYINTKTWDEFSLKTTVAAVFLPTEGAMHVEYLVNEPLESESCSAVEVSAKGYILMSNYIRESFNLAQFKPKLIQGASYFGTDQFYEANDVYHIFENCNSWTNRALKIAGARTVSWAIFPNALISFQR